MNNEITEVIIAQNETMSSDLSAIKLSILSFLPFVENLIVGSNSL